MSEDWLRIVKDKLESCETPVPDGVWENVEASVFPDKTRKVRIMPWVWSLAAAAAVALGVFFSIRLTEGTGGQEVDQSGDKIIAEGLTSPDKNISSSADNGGGQASSSSEPIHIIPAPAGSALAVVTSREDIPDIDVAVDLKEDDDQAVIEEVIPQAVVDDVSEEVEIVEEEVDNEKKEPTFQTDHDGEDWSKYLSATDDDDRRSVGKPSAGLSLSRAASRTEDIATMDTKSFFHGVSAAGDPGLKGDLDIYTRTVSTSVTKNEEFRRPVRFALSLDFPVSNVVSIESGITYSILQSLFTTSSGTRAYDETQTLGYLGIPLNLKLNVLNKDLFTIYTSGGGMVEKCVSGVSKTILTVDGAKVGDPSRQTFSVKPLMWSVNASAGLQLNLPGSFGIFAEPGVSYHFAGDTKARSIYTEHPFDFVMAFGARYSFR